VRVFAILLALTGAMILPACDSNRETAGPFGEEWQGNAIAYSGYRLGQSPKTGVFPSQEQVEEDLRILARNWRLIRVYSADRHSEDVLEVIRREKIDLRVMLGIWLDREPGYEQDNAENVANGIRLANEYEDVVVAVNVGNEILIEWTEHPVKEEQVTAYVREVRAAVTQPVTVADNYVWWRDHGAALAREVDFITLHTYPLFERKDIDEGLSYSIANYEEVRNAHPDKFIVIGEAGWATYTEGNLHVPRGGDEVKQQRYYEELTGWARENRITVFFFEAFDEPWKPAGTESHWGLFTADRKAKPVMQELYPELQPTGPTSPDYPEQIGATGPDLEIAFRADFARLVPEGSINPLGPGVVDASGDGTALRLVFTGESWGGVYFILGAYDASAADAIAMRLKISGEVTALELKLQDQEYSTRSVNLMEYGRETVEDGWRTYSVPLAEFGEIDLTRLTQFGLWNPSDQDEAFVNCELVVADIRFE